MKFLIFFAGLLALGLAVEFKVVDMEKNTTCIMVNVTGTFEYKAEVGGEKMTTRLDLNNAKYLSENSTCSTLKLLLDKDVQVWFDFKNSSGKQDISLISAFVPSKIFNTTHNDSLIFKAESAFQSPKEDSFKCVSEVSTALGGESPKGMNITVMAVLRDFQAQSAGIEGDKFSKAKECSQDIPTTTASTSTTASTTPAPPDNSYSVSSGNVTCINMTGVIAFAITYETKEKGKTNTSVIEIPVDHTVNGSCKYDNSTDMQLLEIQFFEETWKTLMVFKRDGDNYHISQINMTYVFDNHLPDALQQGKTENIYLNTAKDYLKASVEGYYLCNNNVTLGLNDNVTLSTKNFKYQAFNDKSTADFGTGKVSECSQDEDSNSIVPIAVGAALAGLVVIVLIAYLIGRRRSKKSGYESV